MKKLILLLCLFLSLIFPRTGWGQTTYVSPYGSGQAPASTLDLLDEFLGGAVTSNAIGSLGWACAVCGSFVYSAGEAGHPGMLLVSTGAGAQTTAAGASGLSTGATVGPILAADFFDLTFYLRVNTNDANQSVAVGLASALGDIQSPTAIQIRKTAAGTTWNGIVRVGDSETSATASLGTVGTGAWVKLRVQRISSTTLGFQLNSGGVLCITSAAALPAGCSGGNTSVTLPTGAHFVGVQNWNNNTANAKTLDVDYIWIRLAGLTR